MDTTQNDTVSPLPPEQPAYHVETPAEPAVPPASHYIGEPRRHSHAGIIAAALVAALVVGGLAGAAGSYVLYRVLPGTGGSTRSGDVQQVEIIGNETDEVVAAAAAVAVPSVVNIAVSGESSDPGSLPEEHPDVPLQGEGSGVAYKAGPDGGTYIITNNHVIDGATQITVTDSSGEPYEAELIGGDAESDIAVVLVQADIPLIEVGDPDDVVVGQLAIAIGSPFGLQHSVTSGVVSATHRPLTDLAGDNGEYPYVDSIQTDAAINPGNSGGALVNRNGQLIGIPSVIYTDTGSSDGVGLAIPVDRATNAADQLIEQGRVDTPFLGIIGQTVTPAVASELDLPVEEGAQVVEITPDTEAEKAGIQVDDIIVGVDQDRIRSMDDLILSVRRHAVGDRVTLKLWRGGEETTLEMTVGVKPPSVSTE